MADNKADYDIVVLGGGPGGYASALYAASAGQNVALVEKEKVGGTCLHRGCIPAKALLHAAEVFRTVNHAAEHGVKLAGGNPEPDWPAANKRKAGIVNQLHRGLSGLLKRRKVTVVEGHGRLTKDGAVSVDGQTLTGRGVIICTGSVPRSLPGLEIDGERIVSSDHATNSTADKLPERVVVVGGGVIGAEFASVYTDLGVDTTLLEALEHGVLPIGPDRDVANVLEKSLAKRGTKIHASARVGAVERTNNGLLVPFETKKGSEKIETDQVLVSIGRRPVTEDIGCEEAGVKVDRGFIEVDPTTMVTSRPGVYAIGDCVNTPGLAHVAYAEAVVAVNAILGDPPFPVDYGKVPWVVYTHPEVAWAGMTEAEARATGYDVEVHKHSLVGNGRAMILGETDGLVKIVGQKGGGPILGFHLVGPWASELLSEGYLAVNWEATAMDVGAFIHPHPSLAEAIGETMITFSGRSLHG
jgi:dihydrolipoamide dehydrogenase